jgi:signal transduction histidine kinase
MGRVGRDRPPAVADSGMPPSDLDRVHERLKGVADPVSFLANLFAHAPVGFAVWRPDGHTLLTNAAFRDLFGSEPPPEYNVLHDDVAAKSGLLALFERAFRGETVQVPTFWYDPRELETVTVTEGRRVAISMTIFPLFKPDGTIDYVAATYKDETSIRLAHDRLQRSEERLEHLVHDRTTKLGAATRDLEAFTYSVAHDLRAPLRGMDGFAQLLIQDYGAKLDPEGLRCLWRIHENAIRMSELIDGLLALARVTRNELVPTDVDLSTIARATVDELAATEPARDVSVSIQDGLRARADSVLARVLVSHLVANAWKFTRDAREPRIVVACQGSAESTVFFVRDNGAGFDMAHVAKLFIPFQRLHGADEYPGTGIGLATCHRIVDRHGGRIWAEAEPGAGATVFFTLPSPS